MAQYINDPVPKYRQENLNKTTKDLHGYVTGLSDQLQYLLANLDADNIPELPDIIKRLTDAEGNITNFEVTVEGIKVQVQNNKGDIANLVIRADKLSSQITQTEQGLSSRIEQTASQIRTEVNDVKNGLSSQISQTASEIRTQVANNKGEISTLRQTANSLSVQVSNHANSISSLKITANGLESRVSDLNGKYSSLKQTVDGFDFTGMVTFRDLNSELENYPTNRDLERGRTVIDGACISTGQIDVDYIYLHDQMEVFDGRYSGGYIGYCSGYSDDGIGVMNSSSTGQCICTNGGAKLAYGDRKYLGVSRSNIFASEDIFIESDRRVKEEIRYDLDTYEAFYRALKPCSYLLRRRENGRRHTGFIAQEMEQALLASGKTGADFAAYGFDPHARRYDGTGETGLWRVRYGELVALNTAMVQRLMARVDRLEERLTALESKP
ncbi:MAG: gp58-like family protein [Butyricicoccus sp.]